MLRRHIQCRHDIGEIVGFGPTKRAAKDAAIALAVDFCQSIAPVVVGPFIVWREPNGYAYGRSAPGQLSPLCTMGGDLKSACAAAAYHVVQEYWHPGCKLETAIEATGVAQWLNPERRAELTSWIRWQEAYNTARNVGLDETAARAHADSGKDKIVFPEPKL